jgi:hypothetical protein
MLTLEVRFIACPRRILAQRPFFFPSLRLRSIPKR